MINVAGDERKSRDARHRLIAWGVTLSIVGLLPLRAVLGPPHMLADWLTFYSAGRLAGTHALSDPSLFRAFQHTHGIQTTATAIFPYPPAVAYAYAPGSHLSIFASFYVNAVVMLACAAGAGLAGARIFNLPASLGIVASLAWAPIGDAVTIGQNAPLGVLLATLAIGGLAAQRPLLTAIPIGLLLYKPTFALPLLGLLLIRRRWRECVVVVAMAAVWYLLSVAATGGDSAWPLHQARAIAAYYRADALFNAHQTLSLPSLVQSIGAPLPLAIGSAVALLALALPGLTRQGATEAGAAACMIGLAISPHAYAYDAVMLLPMLLLLVAQAPEPLRTRAAFVIYLLPAIPYVGTWLRLLAVIVLGLAAAWIWKRSLGPLLAPRAGAGA
ncbi:DUF2029 domain-containing protein [bacterium]|nr:MAG: DUF2029 domain-containing protein [bacterium]